MFSDWFMTAHAWKKIDIDLNFTNPRSITAYQQSALLSFNKNLTTTSSKKSLAHYDVYYRLLLVLQIGPRHNFLLKPLMAIYIEFTSPKSHKNNRIIVIMTYKKREALL